VRCPDGSECRYPHVHHRGGVEIGTVCQIDKLCWHEKAQRLKDEQRMRHRDPERKYGMPLRPFSGSFGRSSCGSSQRR